jgi:hypothetical protein
MQLEIVVSGRYWPAAALRETTATDPNRPLGIYEQLSISCQFSNTERWLEPLVRHLQNIDHL